MSCCFPTLEGGSSFTWLAVAVVRLLPHRKGGDVALGRVYPLTRSFIHSLPVARMWRVVCIRCVYLREFGVGADRSHNRRAFVANSVCV